MPSASVASAAAVKPFARRIITNVYRTSRSRVSIGKDYTF